MSKVHSPLLILMIIALMSASRAQNSVIHPPNGASIQEVIDGLPESGGVLELLPGTYTFTKPIKLRSNLTIRGPRAAILSPAANFGTFVNTGKISDVVLDGFTVHTSGIALSNADHIVVRNMRFVDTGSTAVNIQDTASNIQILNNVCEHPHAFFCFAVGGSSNAPVAGDHDVVISDNTMENCAGDCILVTSSKRVVISNNTITMCGDTCIESGTGVQNASITGNIVDISGNESGNIVGISTRSNECSTVSGNRVVGNPHSSGQQNCYLAWHGWFKGETPEEYVAYVGNQSAGCSIGFKTHQANHFTLDRHDFQNNPTPVYIDRKPGGATDWTDSPRGAEASGVWPGRCPR